MKKSRMEHLRDLLQNDPHDNFIRYAIGLEYLALNDLTNAVLVFEDLQIEFPDYLPVYYQLGKSYELSGETEKARLMYQKGIDLAANVKEIHTMDELQQALEDLY